MIDIKSYLEDLGYQSANWNKAFVLQWGYQEIVAEIIKTYSALSVSNRNILGEALRLVGGKAIRYSKENPDVSATDPTYGLDCSWLVCYILDYSGITRPKNIRHCKEYWYETDMEWNQVHRYWEYIVPEEKLPWDLVFFSRQWYRVNHMGIYIGSKEGADYMVHAMTSFGKITISPINYSVPKYNSSKTNYKQIFFENPIGYKRVI